MFRKILFVAICLVLLALWAVLNTGKTASMGCYGNLPTSVTLKGLRLFNDVGTRSRVFYSPIPDGLIRDIVESTWTTVGHWLEAGDRAADGLPPSDYYQQQEQAHADAQAAHDAACNPCRAPQADQQPAPAPPARPDGPPVDSFRVPVSGPLAASFGATGSWARYHTGQDFRAAAGADVRAAMGGMVLAARDDGDWAGNRVAIRHADGHTTTYSHLSRLLVSKGQPVEAGKVIGQVGSTGRSFGPHLHFEVYPPGVNYRDVYSAIDPMKWAPQGAYGGPGAMPALASQPDPTGRRVAEDAARRYFPADQVATAVAVAGAESDFRNVTGPTVGRGTMRGMWQINDGAHPQLFAGKDWRNPVDNAWQAWKVWEAAGRSWEPWTTYTSGSYRKYLQASIRSDSPSSENAAPDGTACGVDVKVGTWNVLYGNGRADISSGVRAMAAAGAAVIGLQEAGGSGPKRAVQTALGAGWGMTDGNNAVPIVWDRSRVELLREYRTPGVGTADRQVVRVEGGSVGPKWIQVAQFRNLGSGQTFSVVNTHLLYRVEKGGRPRNQPKRIAVYKEHIRRVIAATQAQAAGAQPAVAIADWNSDFGAGLQNGLLSPLAAAGLVSNWQAGEAPTHGKRTIDGGWLVNATFTGQDVLPKFGSDHSPVVLYLGGTMSNPDASVDGISKGKVPARALPISGMTVDAQAVMRCVAVRYPRIKSMGTRPGHLPSRSQAVDLMLSGVFVDYEAPDARAYGWRVAKWLQANASALGVTQVIYYEQIWTAQRNGEGWRPYSPIAGPGDSSMHRDHVHVSVAGSSGTATAGKACNV